MAGAHGGEFVGKHEQWREQCRYSPFGFLNLYRVRWRKSWRSCFYRRCCDICLILVRGARLLQGQWQSTGQSTWEEAAPSHGYRHFTGHMKQWQWPVVSLWGGNWQKEKLGAVNIADLFFPFRDSQKYQGRGLHESVGMVTQWILTSTVNAPPLSTGWWGLETSMLSSSMEFQNHHDYPFLEKVHLNTKNKNNNK